MKQMMLLIALFSLALVSCEKEEAIPGKTSEYLCVHASSSSGEMAFSVTGYQVVSAKLTYGQSTGTPGQPYLTTTSGPRMGTVAPPGAGLVWPVGAFFPENGHISFWLYDTIDALQTRRHATIVLNDQLNAKNDSVHFRFLHLATGKDQIALRLVRETTADTLVVSGLKSLPLSLNTSSLSPFSHFLKEGDFKVELIDNTGAVLQTQTGFTVEKGTYTTFYTSGAFNSSAPAPFSLNFIQHR